MRSILILVDDLYEELELWYPKIRLEEAGYRPVLAGPQSHRIYHSKHGYPATADESFDQISVEAFSGLIIPGGYAPDKLRRINSVLSIVRKFHEEKKLIAFICHGGWVPISAGILRHRHATGTIAIKDDLVNAGAIWEDAPVVADGHLISSRTPADLALFGQAIIAFLSQSQGPSSPKK